MVATAVRIESLLRADHKEQLKAKLGLLLTLLLEEKKNNEGGCYTRNGAQSTGAKFLISSMIWEISP